MLRVTLLQLASRKLHMPRFSIFNVGCLCCFHCDAFISVVMRETCAPNELRRTLSDQSGYITPPGPSPVAAGSDRCPWIIAVDRRQGIRIVLHTFSERQAAAASECPVSALFDGKVEKSLCPQMTPAVRQRLLHSTDSNELTISFKTTRDRPSRQMNFYLLHYEGQFVGKLAMIL